MTAPIHAHRTSPHVAGNDREIPELAQVIADWNNAKEGDEEGRPPTGWDFDQARYILRRYRRLA